MLSDCTVRLAKSVHCLSHAIPTIFLVIHFPSTHHAVPYIEFQKLRLHSVLCTAYKIGSKTLRVGIKFFA